MYVECTAYLLHVESLEACICIYVCTESIYGVFYVCTESIQSMVCSMRRCVRVCCDAEYEVSFWKYIVCDVWEILLGPF